jgi:serine protease Do
LSVDGKAVESTGALRNLVAATGAAKRVTLSVMRGKQPMTLNVTLGEAKSKGVDRTSVKAKAAALLGLKLDSLTPELRRRLGIPSAVPAGVLVTQVDAGSTAELSGIRRGDVVAEVDKRPVTSTEEFHAAINKRRSGPKALLLVYRGGRAMYLLLEVTKK